MAHFWFHTHGYESFEISSFQCFHCISSCIIVNKKPHTKRCAKKLLFFFSVQAKFICKSMTQNNKQNNNKNMYWLRSFSLLSLLYGRMPFTLLRLLNGFCDALLLLLLVLLCYYCCFVYTFAVITKPCGVGKSAISARQ